MISAIVLAAGEGKRMGATKQLLQWQGKPILQHVLDHLRNSEVDEIILVLGHEGERILQAVNTQQIKVVHNAEFQQGMMSSIRAGLKAVDPVTKGFFIVLGDQPTVGVAVYNRLIEEFHRYSPQKNIFIPTHEGRRGHPALFGSQYVHEAMEIEGDTGLRAIVQRHPEEVMTLEMGTKSILDDLDTPEHYESLKKSRIPGESS